MLKLTYIETGFYLEYLPQSLDKWVFSRVMLSLRVGQKLLVEPSTASFLLPVDLPSYKVLREAELHRKLCAFQPLLQAASELEIEAIAVCVCDAEYVEVSLRGTWLTADGESAEGIFVATLGDRTEFLLFKLWQDQACTSSLMQ